MASKKPIDCSFCDKSSKDVQTIVAGPRGVFICNECIEVCRDIVGVVRQTRVLRPASFGGPPPPTPAAGGGAMTVEDKKS